MGIVSFRCYYADDVERWEKIEAAFQAGTRKKGLGPNQKKMLARWYELKRQKPDMEKMWYDGKETDTNLTALL